MRPFLFVSTVFSLCSAVAFVVANRTETIGNQDSRILYSDGWKIVPSVFGYGGTLAYIYSGTGKASLRVYNASRIAVTVFVGTPGQTVRISLDNQSYDVSPSISHQPAWTIDELDPSTPHDIQIIKQNPAGQLTSFDSILATYSDSPTIDVGQSIAGVVSTPTLPDQSTSSAPLSSETDAPTRQSDGQSGSSITTTAGIAGALVGGACLGLFGALGVYLWRKWSKQGMALNPFRKAEEGRTSVFQATNASDAGTGGVAPFVGATRGVEAEPDRVRKHRRPNGGTDPTPEGRSDAVEDTSPLEEATPLRPTPSLPSDHIAPPPYVP